jgi:hypothetical protein
MKVNVFEGYFDTNPKESSLEDIVELIRSDALLRDRTLKHRYYKSQGLTAEAKTEKASCLNFAVAARFREGKDIGHLYELTFMGMAEFDHLAPEEVQPLVETVRNDPHTLLDYISISDTGAHVLFLYVVTNLTEADRNRYADIYGAAFDVANEYYSRLTGKKTDLNCRKCTQLSGLAHDPKVHYRPDAVPFEVVLPPSSANRKPSHAPLTKAVRAAKAQLAEEGIVFKQGSRNEFLMRMGYLLNAYGVPMDDATDWAIGKYAQKYDGDIAGIFHACYQHTDEHGMWKLPKSSKASNAPSYASVEEIEQFIDSQVSVRFNVIRRQCEIIWKSQNDTNDAPNDKFYPITDRDENTLWCRMKKNGTEVRLPDIRNVLQSEYVPLFHPFEDYFNSLPEWDGEDHIGQLARTVHVKGDTELFVEHFRKWFVGMVATLLDERSVNHEILVFIGEQGNFKSTFFSLLLPPSLQMYFHVKMNHQHLTKDDMITLSEFALVCLEEIDELKNADLNQLKAMVTTKDISERAAYARNKERRKHIASFCGTGNNPNFLTDPTGNRRWLVWQVMDIDNPHEHPFHYTGIYSQALALWKSGFRYWFDHSEIQQLNMLNREFESARPEEELLLTYYRPPFKGCKAIFMKVSEVLERINAGIHQPLSPHRLGIMLKRLGFTKCKYNGERGYLVVERTGEEIQASRKIAGNELSQS